MEKGLKCRKMTHFNTSEIEPGAPLTIGYEVHVCVPSASGEEEVRVGARVGKDRAALPQKEKERGKNSEKPQWPETELACFHHFCPVLYQTFIRKNWSNFQKKQFSKYHR